MKKGENIFKRKDGRWEARYIKGYELSGKIKYGFCYGKTYKEAKKKVTKYKAALLVGKRISDFRSDLKFFETFISGMTAFDRVHVLFGRGDAEFRGVFYRIDLMSLCLRLDPLRLINRFRVTYFPFSVSDRPEDRIDTERQRGEQIQKKIFCEQRAARASEFKRASADMGMPRFPSQDKDFAPEFAYTESNESDQPREQMKSEESARSAGETARNRVLVIGIKRMLDDPSFHTEPEPYSVNSERYQRQKRPKQIPPDELTASAVKAQTSAVNDGMFRLPTHEKAKHPRISNAQRQQAYKIHEKPITDKLDRFPVKIGILSDGNCFGYGFLLLLTGGVRGVHTDRSLCFLFPISENDADKNEADLKKRCPHAACSDEKNTSYIEFSRGRGMHSG